MKMKRTVLAIDDEPANLEFIEDLLSPKFTVLTAVDADEGLRIARAAQPDVILLDINLPKTDGIALCDLIRSNEATRHIPVIMVTAADDPEHRVKAFSNGADDFIGRPFRPKELIARVESKMRRINERDKGGETLQCGNLLMNVTKLEATINEQVVPLSVLDFSLLRHFVQNRDRVIDRTRILEAVWRESVVSDRMVDTHIAYLRKKLDRFGFDQDLATVYGAGYVLKSVPTAEA